MFKSNLISEEKLKMQEEAIEIIYLMIEDEGWSEDLNEYKERIKELYKTEVEHMVKMDHKIRNTNYVKKFFLGRLVQDPSFMFDNTDQLVSKVMNNVSKVMEKVYEAK